MTTKATQRKVLLLCCASFKKGREITGLITLGQKKKKPRRLVLIMMALQELRLEILVD